jgi:hypothetical protein
LSNKECLSMDGLDYRGQVWFCVGIELLFLKPRRISSINDSGRLPLAAAFPRVLGGLTSFVTVLLHARVCRTTELPRRLPAAARVFCC